jgi:hypothetical protein
VKQNSRKSLALLSLALLVGAGRATGAPKAQAPQKQPAAEAELPDVDAIEKGATAPASVSFQQSGPPNPFKSDKRSTSLGTSSDGAQDEASVRQIEGAAVGLIPPGGLYGVESSSIAPGQGEDLPGGSVPEFHVVKKGDTLWSVCDGYFHDPWRWPRLWAQNPLITNPHWIFPGDVIRMHEQGAAAAPVAAASPTGAPLITSTRQGSLTSNALVLRETGFVEAKDLAVSAVINGSREEKIMLSSGDQAYLSFSKDRPLRAGERYTVFVADTEHPVRNPQTKEILGYLVRIYGDVVVDQVADQKSARGTLVDLMDPVERGYMISPVVRQFRRVEPRPSGVNLEVRIVAAFSSAKMLSAETFVVLSRGRKDGLEIGNRSFVVRRGDGYRRIMEGWDHYDPNYPNEVVGELWVVDVRENTSLAWIARSTKEIRVGELAEMRKGH